METSEVCEMATHWGCYCFNLKCNFCAQCKCIKLVAKENMPEEWKYIHITFNRKMLLILSISKRPEKCTRETTKSYTIDGISWKDYHIGLCWSSGKKMSHHSNSPKILPFGERRAKETQTGRKSENGLLVRNKVRLEGILTFSVHFEYSPYELLRSFCSLLIFVPF